MEAHPPELAYSDPSKKELQILKQRIAEIATDEPGQKLLDLLNRSDLTKLHQVFLKRGELDKVHQRAAIFEIIGTRYVNSLELPNRFIIKFKDILFDLIQNTSALWGYSRSIPDDVVARPFGNDGIQIRSIVECKLSRAMIEKSTDQRRNTIRTMKYLVELLNGGSDKWIRSSEGRLLASDAKTRLQALTKTDIKLTRFTYAYVLPKGEKYSTDTYTDVHILPIDTDQLEQLRQIVWRHFENAG